MFLSQLCLVRLDVRFSFFVFLHVFFLGYFLVWLSLHSAVVSIVEWDIKLYSVIQYLCHLRSLAAVGTVD